MLYKQIQTFKEIKNYLNRLNLKLSHFNNSTDTCTPLECVKEIVDTLPKNFWQRENLKAFDSCCSNGNFHSYRKAKTSLDNLYFNEINHKRIKS